MNKTNKLLSFFLTAAIIFAFECIPFLYKDTYSLSEIGWKSVIGIPLGILIWRYFSKKQEVIILKCVDS